jgi:hypothetical protein
MKALALLERAVGRRKRLPHWSCAALKAVFIMCCAPARRVVTGTEPLHNLGLAPPSLIRPYLMEQAPNRPPRRGERGENKVRTQCSAISRSSAFHPPGENEFSGGSGAILLREASGGSRARRVKTPHVFSAFSAPQRLMQLTDGLRTLASGPAVGSICMVR